MFLSILQYYEKIEVSNRAGSGVLLKFIKKIVENPQNTEKFPKKVLYFIIV